MHLSILPIGSDLLVSLENDFYQILLKYAKQKILPDQSDLVYM